MAVVVFSTEHLISTFTSTYISELTTMLGLDLIMVGESEACDLVKSASNIKMVRRSCPD